MTWCMVDGGRSTVVGGIKQNGVQSESILALRLGYYLCEKSAPGCECGARGGRGYNIYRIGAV